MFIQNRKLAKVIIGLKRDEDFDKHYDDFKEEIAKKKADASQRYQAVSNEKKTSAASSESQSTELEKIAVPSSNKAEGSDGAAGTDIISIADIDPADKQPGDGI